MKHIVVLMLLVCFPMTSFGQDWAKVPTQAMSELKLNVGDRIPFKELHHMINYPNRTLRLSDHKPKLILLDFWETTCSPCIKFWPTALRLQEEFGKDLMIVLVNPRQRSKEVDAFLKKRKAVDGFYMNLPSTCRDSTIWKNFPVSSYPRYVWINGDGVVGSITNGKEVTAENVKKWITTGPFKMEQAVDTQIVSLAPWEPIFVNGNGGKKPSDVFIWTSSLTKGQPDNSAGGHIFYDSVRGYGIGVTNTPLLLMYGHAYNNRLREFDYFDFLPFSRMQLIAKDTSVYNGNGTLSGNAFNYQLICGKPTTREQLFKMMQQDLDRYIGLDVKWEKQLKKCFVLSMFDSALAKKSKSLGSEIQVRSGKIVFDSVSVKGVITALEMATWYYRMARYPIVDETGFKGRIMGLRENGDIGNPILFDKILQKYGMRMKLEMREVDVLVLREPVSSD